MSNNLNLFQVAAAQNQKEVTINDQAGHGSAVVEVRPGDHFELIARQTSSSTKSIAADELTWHRGRGVTSGNFVGPFDATSVMAWPRGARQSVRDSFAAQAQ